MFATFDMPDTHESCPRRYTTITPAQALTLLNSKLTLEWAQSFAGRLIQSAGPDRQAQVQAAFRLAYGRPPTDGEREMVNRFFEHQMQIVAPRIAAGEKIALPLPPLASLPGPEAAALVDLCHVLINSNEFVYCE
jgi:hypothetical protein